MSSKVAIKLDVDELARHAGRLLGAVLQPRGGGYLVIAVGPDGTMCVVTNALTADVGPLLDAARAHVLAHVTHAVGAAAAPAPSPGEAARRKPS